MQSGTTIHRWASACKADALPMNDPDPDPEPRPLAAPQERATHGSKWAVACDGKGSALRDDVEVESQPCLRVRAQ